MYDHIGYRCCDDDLQVGDAVPASRVWIDGEATDEVLNGACAVDARLPNALDIIAQYPFARVYKIGSAYRSYGEDRGEIIMQDAIVLELIGR